MKVHFTYKSHSHTEKSNAPQNMWLKNKRVNKHIKYFRDFKAAFHTCMRPIVVSIRLHLCTVSTAMLSSRVAMCFLPGGADL
jgi:hypothetical protein